MTSFYTLARYGAILCLALALPSRAEAQVRVVVGADAAVFAGDLDLTIEGTLDVEGTFNPQSAEVSFSNPDGGISLDNGVTAEIRGTNDFDALAVTGSVTLGGPLRVSLASGASIQRGDTFTLLTCSSGCIGTFNEEVLPDGFDVIYAENDVTVIASSIATDVEDPSPSFVTALHPPSPNPARGEVRIAFDLSTPTDVTLAVFDVTGRHVAHLAQGQYSTGRHEVLWDAGHVTSGLYVIRMLAGGTQLTRSVVIAPH